jgi:ABC-type antimicrobial peptide transport system permease subunit
MRNKTAIPKVGAVVSLHGALFSIVGFYYFLMLLIGGESDSWWAQTAPWWVTLFIALAVAFLIAFVVCIVHVIRDSNREARDATGSRMAKT